MKKIFFIALLFLVACSPRIAAYDEQAYSNTINIKVEALSTMNKAIDDYSKHETEVLELQKSLDKAYEYELHRSQNQITVSMWDIMRDPNKALLGGFLSYWKERGKLNEGIVAQAKIQIGLNFDRIAELESKKNQKKPL